MPDGLAIFRGLTADGATVAFVDGDVDAAIRKAVEIYSGDPLGDPHPGTTAIKIGTIKSVDIEDEENLVEKAVTGLLPATEIEVDQEIAKLNDSIAERGLSLIAGSAEVRMLKADQPDEPEVEERIVFAPVLEPNDGQKGAPVAPDTQGDVYSDDAIRKTAHGWMEKGGNVGLMHRLNVSARVSVLESYLAPVDFTFGEGESAYKVRKGTWLLALRIHDDNLWKKVKDGTLNAFSVGGSTQRVPFDPQGDK